MDRIRDWGTSDMSNPSRTLWNETAVRPSFPSLQGDIKADVAIVGGGLAGIISAALLKRAGKKVVVLESLRVGGGVTGHTTAHLTAILDARYHQIVQKFGKKGAMVAADSHRAAIDLIEDLSRRWGIDCDFTRLSGYLFTEKISDISEMQMEFETALELGFNVSTTSFVPLPIATRFGVRFENQAQFHPLKFLLALAQSVQGDGSDVYENSHVTDVDDGAPCSVVTKKGTVTADDVIVATNHTIASKFFMHTKVAAYRSYVVCSRVEKPLQGLFWDLEDPYHYIRTHPAEGGGHILIVGGEDHKTGEVENTEDCYRRLEEYTRLRFGVQDFNYRWSAQVIEPVDELAFIGRNSLSKHVYIATGFSGNGMTYSALSGRLLTDLILGRENPWASLYEATRVKPLASAKEYVRENVDFPLYMVQDRVSTADAESLTEVHPGEGKIVRVKGEKVAVYRTQSGEIQALSPVCSHMGCHVHWNNAERTWDCPCHGSRFETDGTIINGPALKPLAAKNHLVEPESPTAGAAPEKSFQPGREG